MATMINSSCTNYMYSYNFHRQPTIRCVCATLVAISKQQSPLPLVSSPDPSLKTREKGLVTLGKQFDPIGSAEEFTHPNQIAALARSYYSLTART